MSQKTALVTGASTGFGAAIADGLVQAGYRVIGTSRKAPASGDIQASGLTMAQLDVCEDASVSALCERLKNQDCLPDLVVMNAGFGISGAVEDTPVSDAYDQFNTNFFGVHRLVRELLPMMRERRSGRLIVIGSVAAQIPVPFQAFYSASKSAVATYAEALRMEVAAFGISVSLIEPGDHKTEFGAARTESASSPESAYEPQSSRAIGIMEANEQEGAPATNIAKLVIRIANARRPKFRYVAANTFEHLGLGLRKILPASAFEKMIMSTFKVPRN